jgi:hypothetical protein
MAFAGARVLVRGAGVRTSARTNAAGVARVTVRARSGGVIRFRVVGSIRCGARMGALPTFAPPILTG